MGDALPWHMRMSLIKLEPTAPSPPPLSNSSLLRSTHSHLLQRRDPMFHEIESLLAALEASLCLLPVFPNVQDQRADLFQLAVHPLWVRV